jgi:hypothetical protein
MLPLPHIAACPPAPEQLNRVRDRDGVLVLPGADHSPAGVSERRRRSVVPGAVGGELLLPPSSVRSGGDGVLRARVPKAAVDEDRDPRTCEHDVRATGELAHVHPEPEAATVKLPTQRHFGPGIPGAQYRHEPTHRRTGGGGPPRCRIVFRDHR